MNRILIKKQMIENADKTAIQNVLAILVLIVLTMVVSNINFSPGVVPLCIVISIYLHSIFSKEIEICIDGYVQNIYDFLNGNILRDITES